MLGKSTLIGAAGEYHVMSELLQRNMVGALAPEGVPTIDILVSSPIGDRLASLQVKTRYSKGPAASWPMNQKHETIVSDALFYCFVNLFEDPRQKPETFIVPSKVVSDLMKLSHRTWLSGTKKNGDERKNTPMRSFARKYSNLNGLTPFDYSDGWLEQYRDRWDLLAIQVGGYAGD
jgi:hypothetical protein